jgi:hypothetical protein
MAKTQRVYSHDTKHGTAEPEPFHFPHMGLISDVPMLRRLRVADFGHLFDYSCN